MLAGTEMRAGGASQPTLKKPQRSKESAARSVRRWMTGMVGSAAAMAGFFMVLWLTAPTMAPQSPAIAILANATVSDAASLMVAVQTAGLRGTSDVKGAIEDIKRLENDRVTIKGWVTDATAPGSALTVVAFAGGNHVLTTVTNGARTDIAKMLGLADPSVSRNMSFQGAFACMPGEKIVVVAVTSGAYSQFRSLTCP